MKKHLDMILDEAQEQAPYGDGVPLFFPNITHSIYDTVIPLPPHPEYPGMRLFQTHFTLLLEKIRPFFVESFFKVKKKQTDAEILWALSSYVCFWEEVNDFLYGKKEPKLVFSKPFRSPILPDIFDKIPNLTSFSLGIHPDDTNAHMYHGSLESLPSTFQSLVNLEYVALWSQNLTHIPCILETLPSLKTLDLRGNPIKGDISAEIWGEKEVKILL